MLNRAYYFMQMLISRLSGQRTLFYICLAMCQVLMLIIASRHGIFGPDEGTYPWG